MVVMFGLWQVYRDYGGGGMGGARAGRTVKVSHEPLSVWTIIPNLGGFRCYLRAC